MNKDFEDGKEKDNTPATWTKFEKTDPELAELWCRFAYVENAESGELDERTRNIAILSALIGSQSVEYYEHILAQSLRYVSPVEVKETVYQAVAYLGMGRVYPFINATNRVFEKEGIKLPLKAQATTDPETRLKDGVQAQVDIFGDGMKDFYKSGPKELRHINRWLADNCFGDYYTRGGLDYATREVVTFCLLFAQGGCEPQLKSHIAANLNLGNGREFLINVVSKCLPYVGYPRSLNAIECIKEVTKQM